MRKTAKYRLLKRTEITSSCWIWKGKKTTNSYGAFFLEGKNISAHRASWIIHKGKIPEGMCVCHNCPGGDNRLCINPDHLWIGTQLQNLEDGRKKGVYKSISKPQCALFGVKNPHSILDEDKVRYIRFIYDLGFNRKEIADFFGVSYMCIYKIAKKITWSHV